MQKLMNMFKKRSTIVVMVAIFGLFGAILLAPQMTVAKHKDNPPIHKVDICHATSSTSNPYITQSVDMNGTADGHLFHTGGIYPTEPWGDIIPNYDYQGVVDTNYQCPDGYHNPLLPGLCGESQCIKWSGPIWNPHHQCKDKEAIDVYGTVTFPGLNWTDEGKEIYNNECKIQSTTIEADKVICDDEKYLPNGNISNPITADTAENWVKKNKDHCRMAKNWDFKWWTNNTSKTSFSVKSPATIPTNEGTVKLMEVLPTNYLGFSNDKNNDYTAEFYCGDDVTNYDNEEWLNTSNRPLTLGSTNYCVGFNVEKKVCGDGDIDTPNDKGIIEQCDYGAQNGGGMGCTIDCQLEPATVHVDKVVCDTEYDAQHPNWGLPNWGKGGPNITKNTAQDYVDNSEDHCKLVDWQFQWRPDNDLKPGDPDYNPGDNLLGIATGIWSTPFSNTVDIDTSLYQKIYVREIWDNPYVPFTYNTEGNNSNDFSAEIYCNNDVRNYDNLEWINIEPGNDYYCVAFNAINKGKIVVGKYNDLNMDGRRQYGDSPEPGIADWNFRIYDDKGVQIGTDQTTGPNGWTTFKEVIPGDYKVCEDMPAGWASNDADLYDNGGDEYCKDVTVGPGETVKNFRFGNYMMTGSIQGRKYYDVNANGDFDKEEKNEAGDPNRLNDWDITLYDTSWNQVGNTHVTGETGLKGQYKFENIKQGTYYVCEENRTDDGWFQTEPASGEMYDGLYCHTVNVTPNKLDVTGIQFGNYQSFDIHGYKWHDYDGNQIKGEGEELMDGWTIELYDAGVRAETPMKTMVTSSDPEHFGWYWFEDLPASEYMICEVPQEGWSQTFPKKCHLITLPISEGQNTCMMDKTPNAVESNVTCNFGNWESLEPTITKEVDKEAADIGETLTYTITVNNPGDEPIYGLEVVDTLPSEVTLIEGSVMDSGDYTTVPGEITWQIDTLNGMDTWTTTFQATVNELPEGDNKIENLAELYKVEKELLDLQFDAQPLSFLNKILGIKAADAVTDESAITRTKIGEDTATTIVTVFGGPFLTIAKDVDATEADAGDTLNYTIVVTNIGDQPATDVVIDDVLPSGLTYQDGTTTKEWLYDTIASGDSETIKYVAIIDPEAVSDDYQNIASVTATGLEMVEDDAVTSVNEEVSIPVVLGEEALPGLSIDKSVNVEVANPGQTITYTVVVTNTGDAVAEDTVLIDHIAPGLQFTDTVAPTHTWLLGDIMPDKSVTTTYDVIVLNDNEPGMYPNTAEAWAAGVDNVYDTAEVEVQNVKVLGAETLPTTGGSMMTFIYLIGAGLVLTFSGLTMKLTIAKK